MNRVVSLFRISLMVLIGFAWSISGCGQKEDTRPKPKPFTREQLLNANQADSRRESDVIDSYINHHHLTMSATGTGLRFQFLRKSEKGDSARVGLYATVDYKVSLLDGTVCYSSAKDGRKEFRIGEDHVESGIHEMVMFMKTGDKVTFILPSNRAQGLLGDGDKIPPRAPVLYEMELISLR